MHLVPVSWPRLVRSLAERIAGLAPFDGGPWLRVAVDGAPAAPTGRLADDLATELRTLGRPAVRVPAGGFLRPASLRLEYGRRDAGAYYERWFDTGALWREVLGPLSQGGSGRILTSLWDPVRDRATREPYTEVPPGGVLLLDGPLLLGHGFPLDLGVHLQMSAAALARRTGEEERWTLPAFDRYDTEVAPADSADVVIRCDDPRHPAWTG